MCAYVLHTNINDALNDDRKEEEETREKKTIIESVEPCANIKEIIAEYLWPDELSLMHIVAHMQNSLSFTLCGR